MFYDLSLPKRLVILAGNREMQQDRARLIKVCCAPMLPVQLQGAPLHASLQV
jgi:predicted RNA polymerase sigma factor